MENAEKGENLSATVVEKSADGVNGSTERNKFSTETVENCGKEENSEKEALINSIKSVVDDIKQKKSAAVYFSLLSDARRIENEFDGASLAELTACAETVRLVKAGVGLYDAYRLVHLDEIVGRAVDECRRKCAAEFSREKAKRVKENGLATAKNAPLGVAHLSPRGIADILHRVENGAKISF